jgi:hypothetical protein
LFFFSSIALDSDEVVMYNRGSSVVLPVDLGVPAL